MGRLDMSSANKVIDDIDEAINKAYLLLSLLRSSNPAKQASIDLFRTKVESVRDNMDDIRPSIEDSKEK